MENWAEGDLALELATAAEPILSEGERSRVFMSIGADDPLAAIECLLDALVAADVRLPDALVARVRHWHTAYAGHPRQARIVELIGLLDRCSPDESQTA